MLSLLHRARAVCMVAALASIWPGAPAAAGRLELAPAPGPPPPSEDPPAAGVMCAVEVERLPAVLLDGGDYRLLVPDQLPIPLRATGRAQLTIVEPVVVQLDGPAFTGTVALDPARCSEGVPEPLAAEPKPARLMFQAGVPLSELVVSCVSGCSHRYRTADHFPTLPLDDGSLELVVELEFKARGHRSRTLKIKLGPGDNPVLVTLDRAG